MGWNNRDWNNSYNSNRGGYNNRNGNYNDRGGRGYNEGYTPSTALRYEPGQKCTLTYNTNKTVVILRLGREQYECRDIETLHVEWLYEHELEPVQE